MNALRQSFTRLNSLLNSTLSNSYAAVIGRAYSGFRPTIAINNTTTFLKIKSPIVEQTCGFKVKYKLKKRCKDCYLVVRDGRSYIICPTHPRHKQMGMVKKPKYTWIITHASQSKERPW